MFFESEKWHVDCVTDFHMLLPPFCGIHFLCYHYKFGFWRAQRTYIIISFVSVCFHFECVHWCMKLPFCSYSSTYSVDFFFLFQFSVAFIQALYIFFQCMYTAREFYFLFAVCAAYFFFLCFHQLAFLSLLKFCFLYHHNSTLVSFTVHYVISIGKLGID